ncbi:MAG: hypothetical protein ACTSRJ_01965 [Candidatus Hodarchaeales archaeon]|jgi:hypothetical protein
MSKLNRFFTEEVGDKSKDSGTSDKKIPRIFTRSKQSLSLNELTKKDFLELIEPVINLLPGFSANLAWTRQKILPNNPNILPEELASTLKIPILEAYFIIDRLNST